MKVWRFPLKTTVCCFLTGNGLEGLQSPPIVQSCTSVMGSLLQYGGAPELGRQSRRISLQSISNQTCTNVTRQAVDKTVNKKHAIYIYIPTQSDSPKCNIQELTFDQILTNALRQTNFLLTFCIIYFEYLIKFSDHKYIIFTHKTYQIYNSAMTTPMCS